MSKTMLISLEMAESGKRVIEAAGEIVRVWPGNIGLLHIITVRDTLADPDVLTHNQATMAEWKEKLRGCGASEVSAELVQGIPWLEIGNRTELEDVACVLMGSHGKGRIARMLLGSQTANVLVRGKKPLLIIRLKSAGNGEDSCILSGKKITSRILYAVDSSASARERISAIAWMARALPDELVLIHVEDPTGAEPMAGAEEEALIKDLKAAGFSNIITMHCTGDPARNIMRLAEERQSTLIVLGAKEKHGIRERALGSVTDTVVHNARTHVLVVR
jgi:nucleotide-binding universal stress UspA family protein